MACQYYYFENGIPKNINFGNLDSQNYIVGRTMEEIRDLLMNRTNDSGESFAMKYGKKEMIFYHKDTVAETTKSFLEANNLFKTNKNGYRVTKIVDDYVFENDSLPDLVTQKRSKNKTFDYQYQALLFELHFRRDFGTLVHEGFSINPNKISKEYVEEIKKVIKQYGEAIKDKNLYDSFINKSIPNFVKTLYDEISNNKLEGILSLITSIINIRNSIMDKYPGAIPYVEYDVASRGTGENVLRGTIDLALITPDNKVILIDFKTSPKSIASQKSRLQHFLQLDMYKHILMDYGIDENDISYINIQLTYNTAGTVELSEEIINPEDNISGKDRATAYKFENRFFKKPVLINKPEIQEKIDRAKKRATAIASNKLLKSCEKDVIRSNVEKWCRNNNKGYSRSEEKVVKFEFEDPKTKTATDDTKIKLFNNKGELIKTIEISKYVDLELKAIDTTQKADVSNVIKLLKDKNLSGLQSYINYDLNKSKAFWSNLYPYMSDDCYEYVEIPFLEEFGLVCMKNILSGSYDFIKIISDSSDILYSRDTFAHILSSVVTNPKLLEKYREANEVLRPSIHNIHLLQSVFLLSEFSDMLLDFKLGNIKCISTLSGQTSSESVLNLDRIGITLKLLLLCCKDDPSMENANLFTDIYDKFNSIPKSDIQDLISEKVIATIKLVGWNKDIKEFREFEWNKSWEIEEKIRRLETLINVLKLDYSTELSSRNESIKGGIDYCYGLILQLQNTLRDANAKEMNQMSSYGISFKESILQGYNLLSKGTVLDYNRMGMQITGLAQALESSVPYANPDQLNRRFKHFYDVATGLIYQQLLTEVNELNIATEKFITWGKQYGLVNKAERFLGNHIDLYKTLLLGDNDISRDMLFKNPYDDKGLENEQKEYLKILLWSINRHRLGSRLANKYKHMSYTELEKSDGFNKYLELIHSDSSLLNVPLKKKDGSVASFKGFGLVVNGKKTMKEFLSGEIDRMKYFMENVILNDQLRAERDDAIEKLEYYNYYKENEESRVDRTTNTNPNEWELNLNKLAVDYALADIKEMYFTDLLKIADRALGEIKILEITTGQDFSKLAEALLNQVKISVYGKTLADKEWNDAVAAMGILKQLMSYVKISVRPALFIKEMILGRIRNTSVILSKIIANDEGREITMNHLQEAASIVFGPEFFGKNIKKLFNVIPMGSKTIADALNDVYSINDRDLSVIGEKFSFDRYGLYNWASRMLYLNTIAPDWFNRMIIFIAKMKADGVWNAHTYKDNLLIYDPSKDERIKEFWNNRYHPLNTRSYKDAEAFYKLRMQLFEKEGWKNPDGTSLKYGQLDENGKPQYDKFPRCYTAQEQDSIKEQIGLVYGYYSHEDRANMQKGLWWVMHTQFLTWFPAEIRKYLATGTESSIIKTVQEVDPITGKKLYWEVDENGMHTKTEREIDNNGNINSPVLKDIHQPYMGLLTSTLKTIHDICHGNFDKIKENPQLLRNTELFLFNQLFALLIQALLIYLTYLGIESRQVRIAEDLLSKTANELDFYHTVMLPVEGFGLVGVNFAKSTFLHAFKTIQSDGYSLYDMSEDTFAIVKDLHLNIDV